MQITKEMLQAAGARAEGYQAFCREYPEKQYPDGADYQAFLDICAERSLDDFAIWMLGIFHARGEIKHINNACISEKSVYAAGTLVVHGRIDCKKNVGVGWTLKSDDYIKAGHILMSGCTIGAVHNIKAGDSIIAGEGIHAGYGAYAGRSIKAGNCISTGHDIIAGQDIISGSMIDANSGIHAGREIDAEYYIWSGGGITAGGSINTRDSITAGGRIKTGDGMKSFYDISAGCEINAAYDIVSERNVKAGYSINSGGRIKAGKDYGVYAGLRAKPEDMSKREIRAAEKPENIMCGIWVEKGADQDAK